MPSLPQVLHEATSRSASEIVLESGQAPMVRTDAGAVSVGDPLTEMELFDALAQVLGPDQQAELAVGNVVEFDLQVDDGLWRLVTEPSSDGIVVRGRTAPSDEAAARPALDLPKLDPVEPEPSGSVPRTNNPILRRGNRRTAWDIGVPAAPENGPGRPATPPTTAPKWSQKLSDAARAPGGTDFEIRTPTGEQPANLVDAHEADDDDELPDLIAPPPAGNGWDDEERSAPSVPPPSSSALSDSPRSPLEDGDAFAHYGQTVPPATLCFVQGEGVGEQLAVHFEGDEFTLIDDAEPDGVLAAAAELEPGGSFVVRLEDPSACLGWVLRRLEEGARVVVETRARTPEGAQRILLGVASTVTARGWLDAHARCWLARDESGWTMTSLG